VSKFFLIPFLFATCINTFSECCVRTGKEKRKERKRKEKKIVNYKIETDLGDIGWGGVDWISLAQDRNQWRALVNAVINFRVP
jgi:hypothetical protein